MGGGETHQQSGFVVISEWGETDQRSDELGMTLVGVRLINRVGSQSSPSGGDLSVEWQSWQDSEGGVIHQQSGFAVISE